MRVILSALLTLACAPIASADVRLSLDIDAEGMAMQSVSYDCEGTAPTTDPMPDPITVQYINTRSESFALLPVEGKPRLFVNVIAGSGARYVSGPYEWWTKGAEATLRDVTRDTPLAQCRSGNG